MEYGRWMPSERKGYPAWIGETEKLSLCVVPALGSKVVSLTNRATNREWLWSSGKPLGNRGYGTPFSSGDESGWDEMFPGINECEYPEQPWQGRRIPDHGEVWSLPWEDRCSGAELTCAVDGVNFPYRLEKTYSFVGEAVLRIDYVLTNRSEHPFSFQWAAHPLLRVREGMRLRVPAHPKEIEVSYSGGMRLGEPRSIRAWPIAETKDGGTVDLGVLGPPNPDVAEKYYFAGKLAEGTAELRDPATGESFAMRFPADRVPYLAVWDNAGAYGGYSHFAIEPATARMDELSGAMARSEAATVEGKGSYRWHLEVAIT